MLRSSLHSPAVTLAPPENRNGTHNEDRRRPLAHTILRSQHRDRRALATDGQNNPLANSTLGTHGSPPVAHTRVTEAKAAAAPLLSATGFTSNRGSVRNVTVSEVSPKARSPQAPVSTTTTVLEPHPLPTRPTLHPRTAEKAVSARPTSNDLLDQLADTFEHENTQDLPCPCPNPPPTIREQSANGVLPPVMSLILPNDAVCYRNYRLIAAQHRVIIRWEVHKR